MKIIWPMGCKKIESEGDLLKVLTNDQYLGQEKIDGVRGVLQFLDDGQMVITTRGSTKANPDIPIDISHRLPHIVKYRVKALAGTVLDGELYDRNLTSAELAGILNYRSTVPVPPTVTFRAFDIIYLQNTALFSQPNWYRMNVLRQTIKVLRPLPVEMTEYVEGFRDKEELLYHLLSIGLEGMVFKNRNSIYQFGTPKKSAKPANTWYKYKKKDTVDVTIIGGIAPDMHYTDPDTREKDITRYTKPWEKGWIGSIEFRFVDDDGTTHIGSCSGITDNLREILSDSHKIKHEYIGRTMEVEFMEKTTDGNLRHPRFVRIREDIEHENG